MTKLIDFAVDLTFPLDVATQTLAFIARKRAGKSYAAGKLVEGLYENGVQFVIVDPVGNWYGLRLAADGKSPGLDVPVLGGLRGDIPLDPHGGKLVAALEGSRGNAEEDLVDDLTIDGDAAAEVEAKLKRAGHCLEF